MNTQISIAPLQAMDKTGSVFMQHAYPQPLDGHTARIVLEALGPLMESCGEIIDSEAIKQALSNKVKANEEVIPLAGLWENISEWQHYGAHKCKVHVTCMDTPECSGGRAINEAL